MSVNFIITSTHFIAFKIKYCGCLQVASIAMDEEEDMAEDIGEAAPSSQKDWMDIIPEGMRKKVQEEEEQKKQLELYLPPRSRKRVRKVRTYTSFSQLFRTLFNVHLMLFECLEQSICQERALL